MNSLPSVVRRARTSLLASSFVAVISLLAGCPGGTIIDPGPPSTVCENNDQCTLGSLCVAGVCVIASCDPVVEDQCDVDDAEKPDTCCRSFENCDATSLKCVRDPNAPGCPATEPDCIPCEKGNDCFADLGFDAFCSGGRCFDSDGRTACTEDFQCSNGDRCDRTNFFCVPDAGGCRFCADFPELCCSDGQVCDAAENICIDIQDGDQCTPETAAELCRPDQKCDENHRCVFCTEDADCGIGTVCNVVAGKCVGAASGCNVDADCADINPVLRCIGSTCTAPQCESDGDCFRDDREVCEGFQCVLPPAVCNETDEPNNSLAGATEMANLTAAYGGVLCRGDTDFISFPVQPLKRYTVTVTMATTPFSGITVTLFNSTGGQESNGTFAFTSALPVLGVTSPDETGRFVVGVSSAGATQNDSWRYSVTVSETEASPEPDCSETAQANHEPNDTAVTAKALTLGTALDVTRCGVADDDFFKVSVPPQNGVSVVVDGYLNAEGNINPSLLRGPAPGTAISGQSPTGSANIETLVSPEGPAEFLVKVTLGTTVGALPSQAYRLVATAVPRPATCDADIGESHNDPVNLSNDDTFATPQALPLTDTNGLVSGAVDPLRCNAQDVDNFSFTIPGHLGGTLRLTSTHSSGDLKLELLNGTTGALLLTSNAASGIEAIDLPQLLDSAPYIARVSLGSTASPNTAAQTYNLAVTTFDAGTCLDAEPTPDNTFATARCIGDFAEGAFTCNGARLALDSSADLAACGLDATADGCSRSCGNSDLDVYRIGLLAAGRTVTAHLEFNPDDGDLSIEVAKATNGVPAVASASARDTDHDGIVDLDFLTVNAPKEHLITVRPQGSTGHEAQLYALSVSVSDACAPDEFDGGTNNSTPATATLVRADPVALEADDVVNATVCSGDTADVYEILGLANEEITATLVGPTGARLRIGTRPTNLANPAVTTTQVPTGAADVVLGDSGTATMTVLSSRVQQLYLTVDRTTGADVGTYTLTIDYTPPVAVGEGEGE